MAQDDKNLLLQDLCARLPYGVKVSKVIDNYISNPLPIRSINLDNIIVVDGYFENGAPDIDVWSYEEIKPYLFPLSSMTEEQKEEYDYECNKDLKALSHSIANRTYVKIRIATPLYYGIDWLNKNHFDYRGLIEKGLAFDATGLNIY